jgi:hypothetical protein
VLLLAPDVSMFGYLAGNKWGAVVYNFFHHKALALLVYIAGIWMNNQALTLAGVILFSHASMDRIFGYGFKYFSGFKQTHLGDLKANHN